MSPGLPQGGLPHGGAICSVVTSPRLRWWDQQLYPMAEATGLPHGGITRLTPSEGQQVDPRDGGAGSSPAPGSSRAPQVTSTCPWSPPPLNDMVKSHVKKLYSLTSQQGPRGHPLPPALPPHPTPPHPTPGLVHPALGPAGSGDLHEGGGGGAAGSPRCGARDGGVRDGVGGSVPSHGVLEPLGVFAEVDVDAGFLGVPADAGPPRDDALETPITHEGSPGVTLRR